MITEDDKPPLTAQGRDPTEPVDARVASRRGSAVTAAGKRIEGAELEAAEELNRIARRLGLSTRMADGFRLYAAYRRYRRLREATRELARR